MRARLWREYLPIRSIPAHESPVVCKQGDVVLVAVFETWAQAAEAMRQLEDNKK